MKVAGAVVKGAGALRVDLNQADWDQIRSESGGPNAVLFAYARRKHIDSDRDHGDRQRPEDQ